MKNGACDLVVVGAGFAGLAAATALKEAGLSVVVLEARDRVGGRVEARINSLGEMLDTGGQFFCQDMPEIVALVRRHGGSIIETPFAGRAVEQPPPAIHATGRQDGAAIRNRMKAIDPDSAEIAEVTVAAWLARQDDGPAAQAAFASTIQGLWCRGIDEIPLWYLISNDRRVTNEVSELQYHPAETMHRVAQAMATALDGAIRLSEPVRLVEHGPEGVRVTARTGTFCGHQAIVAVPPVMANRLEFSPALPRRLSEALGAWRSGSVIKIVLRYARAFWRDLGLSGMVMWREPAGLFACDASRDDTHPALVMFVGGPLAEAWRKLEPEGIRAEAVRLLTIALGPDAAGILDFSARDWTDDPRSGGGYSDIVADLEARNAETSLISGHPPLHFACSELSPSFPGYIEGAVVAGRAAAQRVLNALQSSPASSSRKA